MYIYVYMSMYLVLYLVKHTKHYHKNILITPADLFVEDLIASSKNMCSLRSLHVEFCELGWQVRIAYTMY